MVRVASSATCCERQCRNRQCWHLTPSWCLVCALCVVPRSGTAGPYSSSFFFFLRKSKLFSRRAIPIYILTFVRYVLPLRFSHNIQLTILLWTIQCHLVFNQYPYLDPKHLLHVFGGKKKTKKPILIKKSLSIFHVPSSPWHHQSTFCVSGFTYFCYV